MLATLEVATGAPSFSFSDLAIACADKAQMKDALSALPEQLDTPVGEGGDAFSVGARSGHYMSSSPRRLASRLHYSCFAKTFWCNPIPNDCLVLTHPTVASDDDRRKAAALPSKINPG